MEQLDTTYLNIAGHAVQTLGISAIALLFYMLYRTAPVRYFLLWVYAWGALFIALLALHLGFRYQALDFLEFFYFAGEYFFAACLWLGLRAYPRNQFPSWRRWWWLGLVIALWSLLLTFADSGFHERFIWHCLAFAASLLPAWWALYGLSIPVGHRHIKIFTLTALTLLMLIFLANGLSLTQAGWWSRSTIATYHAYQSIVDMMIEMLLAVGLLSIAAANMQAQLVRINKKLEAERDRMSMLAHRDALTDCFNRRALMELETRIRDREGLLVMVDINHLKQINDNLGHQTGDAVIQQVATALQNCMREHDYVFRYGGDEFLLVAFDFPVVEAETRMREVDQFLSHQKSHIPEGCSISISWGLMEFNKQLSIGNAIALADKLMYENKKLIREN